MTLETDLQDRSQDKCELCPSMNPSVIFLVPPQTDASAETCLLICDTCNAHLAKPAAEAAEHWRCLSTSMWSDAAAVQVMAWRLLNQLKSQSWAQDLLDMLYLDEETQGWALLGSVTDGTAVKHRDCNGADLGAGDTVTLIKDLPVKGAGFTAKRGTAVRGISLVADNPDQIEGRVNGQHIVILTAFVKKTS